MGNLEAQKQRIQQFLEGIIVNGITHAVRFIDEPEEGMIEIELIPTAFEMPSLHLSIPSAQPLLILEDAERAVIADILSKTPTPSEVNGIASVSALGADRRGDFLFCKFHCFADNEVSRSVLSDEGMDRLCAAWIAWRTKRYEPPMALGDLDDHPF